MPLLTSSEDSDFQFGKGRIIREGEDITIIGTGETVYPALQAAKNLEEQNIYATVISMHTIKPLDTELLSDVSKKFKAILTVEEHSVYGGLGEACASWLLQHNYQSQFKIMGIPDEYTVTGSQQEIFNHYGISEKGIAENVLQLLEQKNH